MALERDDSPQAKTLLQQWGFVNCRHQPLDCILDSFMLEEPERLFAAIAADGGQDIRHLMLGWKKWSQQEGRLIELLPYYLLLFWNVVHGTIRLG